MEVNTTDELKEILYELKSAFKKHYKNRFLKNLLYGSRARGDEEKDSDIDILVILKDPVDPINEILNTAR